MCKIAFWIGITLEAAKVLYFSSYLLFGMVECYLPFVMTQLNVWVCNVVFCKHEKVMVVHLAGHKLKRYEVI